MLLKAENIHVFYGNTSVLNGASVSMEKGSVVALLGRNGAGKSTLLKTIMGLIHPSEGKIFYNNKEITAIPAFKIPKLGIAYVPQNGKVFPELSIEENFALAFVNEKFRNDTLLKVINTFLDLIPDNSIFMRHLKSMMFDRPLQKAKTLSGGEQQVLCIARAISTNPELLIMDEPVSSLSQPITKEIKNLIDSLKKKRGMSIFLIEQRIKWALSVSDNIYIMQKGQITFEGNPNYLWSNEMLLFELLGINGKLNSTVETKTLTC